MADEVWRKDPEAVLDWSFDWSGWLAEGEAITEREVTVTGVTLDDSTESGGVVTVWLSGGTDGITATVACRITTNQGRTDERTRPVYVRHR